MKKLISQLADCTAEIAPKIDQSTAEQIGSDVKTLSQEIKGQRREAWYKLTLDSIKEAAQAIGEVGKPILEITAKLLPLLLPD